MPNFGKFKQMHREFSAMPFKPEYTPGDPTQAIIQSGAPSTKVKVEDAQFRLAQKRQKLQIQAVIGKNGENLGPGKEKVQQR